MSIIYRLKQAQKAKIFTQNQQFAINLLLYKLFVVSENMVIISDV
ncbi:MAG: hypothetical protein ACKPFD_15770 [Dolichospermum sp.]